MAMMMSTAAVCAHTLCAPRASTTSSGATGFKSVVRGTSVSLQVSARPVAQRALSMQVVAANKMSRPNLTDESMAQFKTSANDSGSSSLQIALLTKRIESLTAHLIINKKDYACQRGLKMLLGQRSRLSKYLKKRDMELYTKTVTGLGLRQKAESKSKYQ